LEQDWSLALTDGKAPRISQFHNKSQEHPFVHGPLPGPLLSGKTDDLRTGFKVAKWGAFCHPLRLGNHPAHLKLVSSDRAL